MANFQSAATKRIQIGLLLGRVAETESLGLTDDDLTAALAERATQERTSPAAVRAVLESNGGMEGLANRAQAKKVLDFLRGTAIIEEKLIPAGTLPEDLTNEIDEEEDEEMIHHLGVETEEAEGKSE